MPRRSPRIVTGSLPGSTVAAEEQRRVERALAQPAVSDPASLYDEAYYRSHCGPHPYERNASWTRFFGDAADAIVRAAEPSTAVDVGCALGLLVEALWDRGVRAEGFDLSPYAIGNVRADMGAHCRIASILEPAAGRYDVAICLEVLEHVPAEQTEPAIRNLTALADVVVFSSTPSDFDEPTHVNVRPTLTWLETFAAAGFAPDPRADLSAIAPHAMLLRRTAEPIPPDSLFAFSEIVRARIETAKQRARADEIERHRILAANERDALRAAVDAERELRASLREELATTRSRTELVAAKAEALLTREIAETRGQVRQTELMTHFVVTSRFWRLKLALLRLFGRRT
jgi:hypothetical protein